MFDRIAALREKATDLHAANLIANPQLGDALMKSIDDLLAATVRQDGQVPPPPDKGISQLIGLGPDAADEFGKTRIPQGVEPYDEQVTSERLVAVGDLYYIYQHERIGVFRVIRKLKELFNAGAVRLSSGPGAFGLYQFDRRDVLRYTIDDRLMAYRRAFGYGRATVPAGTTPNVEFHNQFSHFINQVALFWRDKRISDVVRERAYDPSFGSIAIVRRAGLDLRNNLKFTSFGHLNVMRVEVMQLLEGAFKILGSDDVKNLFGTDSAWDTVEEILVRYFNERLVTSPRQRMGVAGREVLRWLAQPHVMKMQRGQFEALLLEIAEFAEECLTSAQSLGLAARTEKPGTLPWERQPSAGRSPVRAARAAERSTSRGARPPGRNGRQVEMP
ncbi:MAG: hypothetical protein QOE70_6218 [Chthoniobacter sp.]|nr:hypothetical protein [Chthoniobacter sp.]